MNHYLDNPIWTALNSGLVPYVFQRGNAVFIDRKMGFFAGLIRYDAEQLDQLYAVMDPGMRVILFTPGFLELDAKWKVRNDNALLQMVFDKPSIQLTLNSSIRPLGAAEVPEMLALTHLAKPGPFLENTIDFGGYFGYFVEGKLVSMAGTRLAAGPYTEVSAVCTHPDFVGRGLSNLVLPHVLNYIQQRQQIPYLQLYPDNLPAYRLYRKLGFVERASLRVYALEK
ncbi:MAG: GNAT family N-acetyltransferase [Algoriphagus sp.]|nr:GNAT family N-acetyltransferase [Algoriphagus sp.]